MMGLKMGVEAFYPSKWWAMLSINGVSSRV